MSTPITEAKVTEMLNLWIAADEAVANGQSYSIGGRSLTRANAREITEKIKFWENRLTKIQRGGMTVRRVLPRDL